jgi:hypothetical protein
LRQTGRSWFSASPSAQLFIDPHPRLDAVTLIGIDHSTP